MTFIQRTLIIVLLLIVGSMPAWADEAFPETTPFEIALLYHKMIGATPDFKKLAMQSPVYLEAPEIGKDIILDNQEKHLEMLYYTLSEKKPIAIIDNFTLKRVQNKEDKSEYFLLEEMDDRLHYIYDIAGDAYIIFIRNAAELKNMYVLSPEQKSLLKRLINSKVMVGAEVVLRPVAADIKPIEYQNEPMRMILADIALLRLIDNTSGEEIIEYTPIKERPKLSKMEDFFKHLLQSENTNAQNITVK